MWPLKCRHVLTEIVVTVTIVWGVPVYSADDPRQDTEFLSGIVTHNSDFSADTCKFLLVVGLGIS